MGQEDVFNYSLYKTNQPNPFLFSNHLNILPEQQQNVKKEIKRRKKRKKKKLKIYIALVGKYNT